MNQKKMEVLRELLGNLGDEVEKERNAAHDLWSWLPSYHERDRHHPRHPEAVDSPSIHEVLSETLEFLCLLAGSPVQTGWFACPCGECEPPTPEEVSAYLDRFRKGKDTA